jgi:hypothetical protein
MARDVGRPRRQRRDAQLDCSPRQLDAEVGYGVEHRHGDFLGD